MGLFVITYLAGVLTIATPCIFPILPFLLVRADEPFRRGALPMLLGLAVTFAFVASLAAVAGGWAVEANRCGRIVALLMMTLFGLTMLLPELATRATMPLAALGSRLSNLAARRRDAGGASAASSFLLGVATGLVWAPCAGPVLGLILTGAALGGPSVRTSLLLLTYAVGAATSLAAGMLVGGRLLAALKRSVLWGDGLRRVLGAAVIAGAACIWLGLDTGILTRWSSSTASGLEHGLIAAMGKETPSMLPSAQASPAPDLSSSLASLLTARQWLNAPPVTPADLRGKVVLVNFWTYSCINCLRALPHVRAWADKYRDGGLVVVGVHTPEFAFEKDAAHVARALTQLGINYPVAIDSDFGIWRSFDNQGWPAFYVVDAHGEVRHRVLGEGSYDETERVIQGLLSGEAGARANPARIVAKGPQMEADPRDLHSGETYIGHALARSFASSESVIRDAPALYRTPPALTLNRWGLDGTWTVGGEFATLAAASGGITYRFHARDLHLVLAPPASGQEVRFRVILDGAPPGADRGTDVDAEGWGSVRDARLYQLVRQSGAVTDRTFRIEFQDPGIRAYVFTFG